MDPTTPPEGKPSRHITGPNDPPTPIELRAAGLGITFNRGRTLTSNSHFAHEAAEHAAEHGDVQRFHRAMFKAYFEDLENIGDIDTVVRVGTDAGMPEAELREVLSSGVYRQTVDEALQWAQGVGVTAVPTFVLGEKFGIVGAQEARAFEDILQRKFDRLPKP